MPLAPMGCEVQVHEKTDKRGSWAYHSVDGWYLNTSPEHYRVHRCYIKSTHNERLSDTVQFQHKSITNPSLTPADKLMNAIANCKEAIQGKIFNSSDRDVQDLKQLLHQAETQITAINATNTRLPRVQNTDQHTVPRVPNNDRPSITTRQHTAEIFHSTTAQRVIRAATTKTKARRRQQPTPPVYLPNQPPALSTRSKVRQAHTTTTTIGRHSSRLRQPTKSSLQRNRQQALSAQLQTPKGRKTFIQQYKLMEKEVEKAMMVLDEESGRMLKYKDLLRHPKYKKQWSISAADEFGRLAQGVGGRIKKPTDTNKTCPKTGKKM